MPQRTWRGLRSAAWALSLVAATACRSVGAGAPPAAPASSAAEVPAGAAAAAPRSEPDPRVDWLAEHAIRLRSVSPADRDYADLEPLRAALAGVRVVLLGEQSHGDGTTFLAKTRLIQFLHEAMGFDVLAFESGLFECTRAWERLREGEAAATAVPRCIFPIWTRSAQVQPLIAYLGERATTERPLELAGFDDQFTGSASREELVPQLQAFLERQGSVVVRGEEWPPFAAALQSLTENLYQRGKAEAPPAAEQERFLRTAEALRAETAWWRDGADEAAREADLWAQVLAGLGPAARQQWLYDPKTAATPPEILRLRDRQMGHNLVWLANRRYPGRKIVVWAATFHAARHLARLETGVPAIDELYRQTTVMGEVAWGELGEAMYTLGFTASEGTIGTPFDPKPEAIAAASPGSLEDLCRRAGLERAIVDLRRPPPGGEWLRQPLASRPLGYVEMRGDWSQVLDGMLYTRVMEPSTPVPPPPAPSTPAH